MKTENWTTIKELLQNELNVPPVERERFLDKTGINGDSRREVESLLT